MAGAAPLWRWADKPVAKREFPNQPAPGRAGGDPGDRLGLRVRERPCRAARTPQELSEPARRRGRRVHAGVTAEGHRPAAGTGVLPSPATLMTGLANISLQMAAGHLKEGLSGPGPTSALPGGTPRHQAACRAAGTPQDTQEPLAGRGGAGGHTAQWPLRRAPLVLIPTRALSKSGPHCGQLSTVRGWTQAIMMHHLHGAPGLGGRWEGQGISVGASAL